MQSTPYNRKSLSSSLSLLQQKARVILALKQQHHKQPNNEVFQQQLHNKRNSHNHTRIEYNPLLKSLNTQTIPHNTISNRTFKNHRLSSHSPFPSHINSHKIINPN
ncbi:hypothetical protein Droror1_Dr00002176 [Drosera rotundifolia]